MSLSGFLVRIFLAKHNRHLIWIKHYLPINGSLNKFHNEHLFSGAIHVQIYMCAPFHKLYQIHKSVDFLRYQPQLLKVLPIYSLNHAVQTFYQL